MPLILEPRRQRQTDPPVFEASLVYMSYRLARATWGDPVSINTYIVTRAVPVVCQHNIQIAGDRPVSTLDVPVTHRALPSLSGDGWSCSVTHVLVVMWTGEDVLSELLLWPLFPGLLDKVDDPVWNMQIARMLELPELYKKVYDQPFRNPALKEEEALK